MNIEQWHQEENRARKILEEKHPDHPVLKKIYSSTYEACKAYWKALEE